MAELIGYAPRTGTKRNLKALKAADWGILVSARGVWRLEGFRRGRRIGDNGAWTSHQEWLAGKRATPQPCLTSFKAFITELGPELDYIVVPDIVQGGDRSWAMTRYWLRRLRRNRKLHKAKLLIAVQDGFEPETIAPYLCDRVGVFIGGGSEWKEAEMRTWVALAHAHGAYAHVARVNTARRVFLCVLAEADSFDGLSPAMYAETLANLDNARRQGDLEVVLARRAA